MVLSALLQRNPGGDPTYPGLVLTLHVVAKGVELGSLAGLGVGVLIGAFDLALAKKKKPLERVLRCCEIGVNLGTLLSLANVISELNLPLKCDIAFDSRF